MIRHIVLFALNDFATPQAKQEHLLKLKKALEDLKPEIPQIQDIQVSFNENPNEPYDFVLEVLLNNMEDLPLYAEHPSHVNVVKEYIAPYKKLRAAIDCPTK